MTGVQTCALPIFRDLLIRSSSTLTISKDFSAEIHRSMIRYEIQRDFSAKSTRSRDGYWLVGPFKLKGKY